MTREKQEEVDLSRSPYFSIRTTLASKPVGNKRLESKEFTDKLVADSRLPRNWFRLYRRQETRDFVMKEFLTPCRRIMRGVDAVRAYMDELPGITQREVDEKIARFSKRTREQYNESLAAERKRMAKWKCDICAEAYVSSATLEKHKRKEHSEEPSDDPDQGRGKPKRTRRPGKRWKCGRCGKDFDRRERLRQHQKRHEGGEISDGRRATDEENSERPSESEEEESGKREEKDTQAEKKSEFRPIILWVAEGREPIKMQMTALEKGNGAIKVYSTTDGKTLLIDGIKAKGTAEPQQVPDDLGNSRAGRRGEESSTGRNKPKSPTVNVTRTPYLA